jgi:predicted HNH restriction endonuclease
MAINWSNVFDSFGVKVVTKTDKAKTAYVPNAQQLFAIAAAGIKPSTKRPADDFKITILNDPTTTSVNASFYHSLRETDPSRSPEPRMGHAFISAWLNVGDTVVIGNIGSELFAAKETLAKMDDELGYELAKKAKPSTVLALARKAKCKPRKKTLVREDFERNPYVVAAAVIRSADKCEMPGCMRDLFSRDDASPYLDVHHVVPLGEGGDDTLVNVAALCPHCHRELHFGRKRMALRAVLAKYVASL